MNWFHKTIAILTLIATGSAVFLTASRMGSQAFVHLTKDHPNQASAISHNTTHSEPTNQTPTDTPSSGDNTPIERSEIIIPDAALTGSNPTTNTVSTISADYAYRVSTVSDELYTRTNIIRSQNNLPALIKDPTLTSLATARSEEMLTQHYFSHTSPDGCDLSCRYKKAQYPSLTWGENLATFSRYTTLSESALAEQFINDWITSSTHRQNILSTSFTRQGIGIASDGEKIVVTVLFARPE